MHAALLSSRQDKSDELYSLIWHASSLIKPYKCLKSNPQPFPQQSDESDESEDSDYEERDRAWEVCVWSVALWRNSTCQLRNIWDVRDTFPRTGGARTWTGSRIKRRFRFGGG